MHTVLIINYVVGMFASQCFFDVSTHCQISVVSLTLVDRVCVKNTCVSNQSRAWSYSLTLSNHSQMRDVRIQPTLVRGHGAENTTERADFTKICVSLRRCARINIGFSMRLWTVTYHTHLFTLTCAIRTYMEALVSMQTRCRANILFTKNVLYTL